MAKTVRALVVAGGGAGGGYSIAQSSSGGGGGAGGMQDISNVSVVAQAYTITIGAGGVGNIDTEGANGNDSSFATVTSTGGGGGGRRYSSSTKGKDGGSGGGSNAAAGSAFGYGIVGQGKNGSPATNDTYSGGGGGAGAVAGVNNGETRWYANGGVGKTSDITGTSVAYAGGGGGSAGNASVLSTNGTYGGGGKHDENGVANTGGGGGGSSGGTPGSGGSGVVIIRYTTADFGTCTGGTKTTVGSDTVHTFTESGTFTVVYKPVLTTQSPTEIQGSTAKGNGTVTDAGDTSYTERGFVWDTASRSDPGDTAPASTSYTGHVTEIGTFTAGTFTGFISSLGVTTTYYVRSYAKNATGYAYGPEVQFVSGVSAQAPALTTSAVTAISTTTAIANGNITDEGVANATERGFVYDIQSRSLPGAVPPTRSGYRMSVSETGSFGVAAFTGNIAGLASNRSYYVRSYAVNSAGYSYGNEVTFTTGSAAPVTIPSATLTNESVNTVALTNDTL